MRIKSGMTEVLYLIAGLICHSPEIGMTDRIVGANLVFALDSFLRGNDGQKIDIAKISLS